MSESDEPAAIEHSYVQRFPDARTLLQAQFERVENVFQDCVFVLDTNALLVPFSIGKESIEQIRQTYDKLVSDGRLTIPGQVVREFAFNRPNKLSELYHALSQKQNVSSPEAGAYPLLEQSDLFVEVQRLESEIKDLLKEYRKAVGNLLAEVKEWTWDDPVSQMYREVFPSEVVLDPDFDEDKLKSRWEESVRAKLPPGYKDGGKSTNADGDLRVWLTILELAKVKKQHLVLVTGDGKADWSHKSNKSPLYPRFELVDEYRRESGGKTFHMVSFSSFLKVYGADQDTVEEVRTSERTLRLESLPRASRRSASALLAEQAVFNWLTDEYPELTCNPSDGRHDLSDFVLFESGGAESAIFVKYVVDSQVFPYRTFGDRLDSQLEDGLIESDNAYLFLVTDSDQSLKIMIRRLEAVSANDWNGVDLIPAKLRDDGSLEVHDIFGTMPSF